MKYICCCNWKSHCKFLNRCGPPGKVMYKYIVKCVDGNDGTSSRSSSMSSHSGVFSIDLEQSDNPPDYDTALDMPQPQRISAQERGAGDLGFDPGDGDTVDSMGRPHEGRSQTRRSPGVYTLGVHTTGLNNGGVSNTGTNTTETNLNNTVVEEHSNRGVVNRAYTADPELPELPELPSYSQLHADSELPSYTEALQMMKMNQINQLQTITE